MSNVNDRNQSTSDATTKTRKTHRRLSYLLAKRGSRRSKLARHQRD